MLKEGKATQEIKASIVKEYMIDEVSFEKDLYDFVEMLGKLKLTEDAEKKKD